MRALSFGLLGFSVFALTAYADPILGTAASYAVLGASTVTNTGTTTLDGNLGLWPGTSITGSGTITLNGVVNVNNGAAQTAQANALTGYNALAGLNAGDPSTTVTDLTGQDLGGKTLTAAGVKGANTVLEFLNTSAQLTGALTLDFLGASDETFVFQIGTTLTTASASSVLIKGAGTDDYVDWVVGSSATLGTTTSFAGSIIAKDSVTMNTGATDGCGSVIALTAAVTLQGNTISTGCTISTTASLGAPVGTVTPTLPTTGITTVAVPEGGSTLLYLCFYIAPIGAMRAFYRRRSV